MAVEIMLTIKLVKAITKFMKTKRFEKFDKNKFRKLSLKLIIEYLLNFLD